MFRFNEFPEKCPGCMKEISGQDICSFCGFSEDDIQEAPLLPLGTVLQERYLLGRAVSVNTEGATYIGFDLNQSITVRVREYFPEGLAVREGTVNVRISAGHEFAYNQGLMTFLELSRSLARLRELPALLPVYDIFEINGTAYRVCEASDAITLREFLLRNGGSLMWEQARPIFMPLLSAVAALHEAGIKHRGISPETILIGRDGKLRLTGFCIAEVRAARTDFAPHLYPGFAAIEQYGFTGVPGEWTDVYAFAATLYRVLVGNPPPEATARVTNDRMIIPASVAERLPAYIMDALANALQILPDDRTQSMEAFREELSASPTVMNRKSFAETASRAAVKEPEEDDEYYDDEDDEDYEVKGGGGKFVLLALLGTLVVVLAVAGVLAFTVFRDTLFGAADSVPSSQSKPAEPSIISIPPLSSTDPVFAVPNVRGEIYANLFEDVKYENFTYEIIGSEHSSVEAGKISHQEPAQGTSAAVGSKVKVKISLGPASIKLPNVSGKTEDEARLALYEAGVLKANIDKKDKWDDQAEPNRIIGCEPGEGKTVNWYDKVTLIYNTYTGPEDEEPNGDGENTEQE